MWSCNQHPKRVLAELLESPLGEAWSAEWFHANSSQGIGHQSLVKVTVISTVGAVTIM
jgi:hypothetical protein